MLAQREGDFDLPSRVARRNVRRVRRKAAKSQGLLEDDFPARFLQLPSFVMRQVLLKVAMLMLAGELPRQAAVPIAQPRDMS